MIRTSRSLFIRRLNKMRHPLRINSQGKVVNYQPPLLRGNFRGFVDTYDPTIWHFTYDVALKYPATYIVIDFKI